VFEPKSVEQTALVPFCRGLLIPLPSAAMSLSSYREVMKPDRWGFFIDAINSVRSYSTGFEAASLLLRATVCFHEQLTARERDRAYFIISVFILEMLDKSDRWEDYLSWFSFLRQHCTLSTRHHRQFVRNIREADEYKTGEDGDFVLLNYMQYHHPRMRLIERKISKVTQGHRTGNLLHHAKEALTPEEVRLRLNRVVGFWKMKQQAQQEWGSYWKSQ
jgi:hypothetical protein